jgi:hypothetical protein
LEILNLLFEAGSQGLLPRDLAMRPKQFKVTRHQISRSVLRMNRRVEKEFDEHVAEKRGWHWDLTSFAYNAWGALYLTSDFLTKSQLERKVKLCSEGVTRKPVRLL